MPDGRIGIAVGDVTDKGVPAALVMARTHSILRAEASRSNSPGEILSRANDLLVPEMPAKMFVTCLFAVLDPAHRPHRVRQRRPQPAVRAHRRHRHGDPRARACRSA